MQLFFAPSFCTLEATAVGFPCCFHLSIKTWVELDSKYCKKVFTLGVGRKVDKIQPFQEHNLWSFNSLMSTVLSITTFQRLSFLFMTADWQSFILVLPSSSVMASNLRIEVTYCLSGWINSNSHITAVNRNMHHFTFSVAGFLKIWFKFVIHWMEKITFWDKTRGENNNMPQLVDCY